MPCTAQRAEILKLQSIIAFIGCSLTAGIGIGIGYRQNVVIFE